MSTIVTIIISSTAAVHMTPPAAPPIRPMLTIAVSGTILRDIAENKLAVIITVYMN